MFFALNLFSLMRHGGPSVSNILPMGLTILQLVGYWKVFEKMGYDGWRGLIPVYNLYVLYQEVWFTKPFFIYAGCLLISSVATILSVLMLFIMPFLSLFGLLVNMACFTGMVTMEFLLNYRLSKSFGHDILYCLGLLGLPYIFLFLIGYGDDTYTPLPECHQFNVFQSMKETMAAANEEARSFRRDIVSKANSYQQEQKEQARRNRGSHASYNAPHPPERREPNQKPPRPN